MNPSLLTRFSVENPCWTEDLLARAGEDVSDLAKMERDGLLRRDSLNGAQIFSLTPAGREAFAAAAEQMFLDEEPGEAAENPARCLMTTELRLELERTNLQRRGLKRYLFRPRLPLRPATSRERVWSSEGGLRWNYLDDPVFKSLMHSNPVPEISERKLVARDPARSEKSAARDADFFVPDLLCIINYDFQNYLDFRGHPGDRMKLINTDRFIFSAAATAEERLDVIGAMHRWLWTQRRLEIPGWFDVDSHEQDSVSWLIFFTRTQNEADAARSELKNFGDALVAPVDPMEIWTISLENLKNFPARCELIWDVLPVCGSPVCRTL